MPNSKENIDFKVKFGSEVNEIDANTLISSLIGISTVIQEINRELYPDKKIEVRVKALQPGSFLIHLHLIEGYIDALMQYINNNPVNTLGELIAILVGILQIKKFLKGKKPNKIKEENNITTIENSHGNIITVDNRTFNIFSKNSVIDSALNKSFETLSKDENITDIDVIDNENKTAFSATNDEFEDLSMLSGITEEEKRFKVEVVELNIFKVVFQEKYKWEFYYQGNRISAKLNDESFYETIDRGESFSKGDILEVELKINQIFDKSVNTYINKSYEINRVIRHLPRHRQPPLLQMT